MCEVTSACVSKRTKLYVVLYHYRIYIYIYIYRIYIESVNIENLKKWIIIANLKPDACIHSKHHQISSVPYIYNHQKNACTEALALLVVVSNIYIKFSLNITTWQSIGIRDMIYKKYIIRNIWVRTWNRWIPPMQSTSCQMLGGKMGIGCLSCREHGYGLPI